MAKKNTEVAETVVEEKVKPVRKTAKKEVEATEEKKPTKRVTKKVEKAEEKTTKKTTRKTTENVEKVEEKKPVKRATKKNVKKEEVVKPSKATIKNYDCIIKPILSEETMKNMETQNKITVQVNKNSNKVEIKNSFEAIFGVKVKQVNVSNVRAKDKRVGKYSGKTSSYKKAVITLAEGQSLELLKN